MYGARLICDSHDHRSAPRSSGFSIVEAVLSVLIAGLMVVPAMNAIASFAASSTVQRDQYRASALARRLLTEIEQSLYCDPSGSATLGPDAGEITGSRSLFNDVDDYTGWTESPPQNKDGTPIPAYTGWSRSVTVKWVDPNNPASVMSSESGMKRITVTVTDPRGRTTQLVALRAAYGAFDKLPSTTTTYTSWVGINLQLGDDPAGRSDGATAAMGQIP